MNRFGRGVGRFGDAGSPGQAPSGVLPPLPPAPGGMNQAQEMDFFDPARDGIDIMFYATPVIASITTGATSNQIIQIDSAVDFFWYASTYFCNDGSNTSQTESSIIYPSVSVVINDTGSRKNLQNTAFALTSVAGPGERPYRLPRPRLFRASSTINFTFNNFSGVTYDNLQFILHGYTAPRGTLA